MIIIIIEYYNDVISDSNYFSSEIIFFFCILCILINPPLRWLLKVSHTVKISLLWDIWEMLIIFHITICLFLLTIQP